MICNLYIHTNHIIHITYITNNYYTYISLWESRLLGYMEGIGNVELKEVKKSMHKKVVSGERVGYLTACVMKVKNGRFCYQAELTDFNMNCIYIVPLESVELKGLCEDGMQETFRT